MKRPTLAGVLLLAACESGGPDMPAVLEADRLLEHIQVLAADSLMGRRAGWNDERKAADYVAAQFEALGLVSGVPGYLQGFHVNADPTRPSQNVIGVLPGRGSLADEWVIVGAHYDGVGYVDTDPPVRPDCWGGSASLPCNGADDNASGTALVIELARVLADDARHDDADDRRSVMFHAYGAEEVGLVGSGYFCAHPTVPLGAIQAMVNLDMVGRLRDGLLEVEAVGTSTAWPDLLVDANTEELTLELEDRAFAASDHYCFTNAGVPALAFFTGFHDQYHTPYDDVDLINAPGMVQVGNVVLYLLRDLVVRPNQLPVALARVAPDHAR